MSVVQQAYVCGVSTRRVDQLVESLGLRISKSEVSRIAGLLDEQVQAFRQRPLEGRYPYLFVDAKIEKVRAGGRVARKCVPLLAVGDERRFGSRSAIAVTPKRNVKGGLDCVGPVSVRRLGANIGCDGPMTSMTVLEDEIDDWGEMTDEERDRLRAMLLDLGLDETDDPDVFE